MGMKDERRSGRGGPGETKRLIRSWVRVSGCLFDLLANFNTRRENQALGNWHNLGHEIQQTINASHTRPTTDYLGAVVFLLFWWLLVARSLIPLGLLTLASYLSNLVRFRPRRFDSAQPPPTAGESASGDGPEPAARRERSPRQPRPNVSSGRRSVATAARGCRRPAAAAAVVVARRRYSLVE